MNDVPDPSADLKKEAEAHLAKLNGQVAAMRAVLVQLLQEVVVAEALADHGEAALLVKANEQLVISALDSQMDADSAHGALEEVSRVSGLDPLTGLANRAVLLDRFELAISNAKRYGNRVGLLFLDIDAFKQINDAFGHASGDRALQLVADCLRSLVRETDTVSRHGGDEFLVLLANITSAEDAALVADKVNAALASYSQQESPPLPLSASIGISVYPEDGADSKTLIARADAAMYLAKKRGRPGPGEPLPTAALASAASHESSQRPRPWHGHAISSDQAQREGDLRAANERLILAALGAQELLAAAEEVRRRQVELLAMIADELSNPYAPIRLAASSLGIAGAGATLLPRVQSVIEEQAERLARMVREVLGRPSPAARSPDSLPQAPRQ